MVKSHTKAQQKPGRPDTWVESLEAGDKSPDPLADLGAKLARLAKDFNVRRPAILLGHKTGLEAISHLRHSADQPLDSLYSFSLAGETLGDAEIHFPTGQDWRRHDGVLCLDADPNSYFNAVQFCFSEGLAIPVLTDFDALPGQFCQMGVRGGDPRTDVFIYNYFTKLYRLKDPLQLIWRVHWADGRVSRGVRIMGPNQSLRLATADLDPPRDGAAGILLYEARHPAFARVPNSRFRGVSDVVSQESCATMHGDEIEPKRVDEGQWFDTHVAPLGGGHDIAITVRNDLADPGPVTLRIEATPVMGGAARQSKATLEPGETERTVSLSDLLGAGNEPVQTQIVARVEGRSCRLEMTEWRPGTDGRRTFACNHGSTNAMNMVTLVEPEAVPDDADQRLLGQLKRLAERDVLPLPYPLPVLPAEDRLMFDFSAGKFLPRIDTVTVAAFDRSGKPLGRETLSLPSDLGYIGAEQTRFAGALSAKGGMLLISPPYVDRNLVTYQNCREDLWIRLSDRTSGDADFAEFQLHNRNMRGYTIPIGFGQAPRMIKARTEMMIRFRLDGDFESRLLLINASPEIGFDRTGHVEIEFNYPTGRAASVDLSIAPQTWEFLDVADLLPAELGDTDHGWVRVVSNDVALSAYAALVDGRGRVGFQHLWGA